MIKLYDSPVVGIPIIEPDTEPEYGDIILGYEVLYNDDEFCAKPRPKHLNSRGWISIALLFCFFWPAMCVPCCMSCSYNVCQRPVYGRTFFPNYILLRSVDIKNKKELITIIKENEESKNMKNE